MPSLIVCQRSAAFSFYLHNFIYLLYLDDAGSPGNPKEDYFVLGGVCVYEAQVEWFSREMDKLATPFDKNPEDIEFHASTIFSRREAPWKTLGIDEARGVILDKTTRETSLQKLSRNFARLAPDGVP